MMVSIDYSSKMLAAYKAGSAAMLMHLRMNGPKPDADKWLEKQGPRQPVVRG